MFDSRLRVCVTYRDFDGEEEGLFLKELNSHLEFVLFPFRQLVETFFRRTEFLLELL